MYLIIDENPNSRPEERVFSTIGEKRPVTHLQLETKQGTAWCEVTGVEEGGQFVPAQAIQVEDSGAGLAWLIFGAGWGIRMRQEDGAWSLDNAQQWGEPFKVLDHSASDIRFGS